MLIALEVLTNSIEEFSHSALNHAFNFIINIIKEGQMLPLVIGKCVDFLLVIDNRSEITETTNNRNGQRSTTSNNNIELATKPWILRLHRFLEEKIKNEMAHFPDNHITFLCYLYAYSEINMHTRCPPLDVIIAFTHKFMYECIKLSRTHLDPDNERLMNSMIILSGRFSLRDSLVAQSTCNLYANVLKYIDRPPIVNNILVALADICKKYTHIVEGILDAMLSKLESPFEVNRIHTFKCFGKLVLQDQLKLRGSLFLCLLAKILDRNLSISNLAKAFFGDYNITKNHLLFQKCLSECPFILNEFHVSNTIELYFVINFIDFHHFFVFVVVVLGFIFL